MQKTRLNSQAAEGNINSRSVTYSKGRTNAHDHSPPSRSVCRPRHGGARAQGEQEGPNLATCSDVVGYSMEAIRLLSHAREAQ